MKRRDGKSQRREEKRRRKIYQRRESQKKEDPGARKGRKVAKHCVSPMICGSGGWKIGSLKRRVEPSGQMRDEKLRALVARSTFPSQNVQNTSFSDHFWKLRCRKSARRCGTKHISKSKCTKHTGSGSLLEVEMSKKCMPLWREAHFQVKSAKNWRVRSTFGRSDVVLCGKHRGLCTWSKLSKGQGFVAFSTTTTTTRHCSTLHYTTLHYTTLHSTPRRYNHNYRLQLQLHYITLH